MESRIPPSSSADGSHLFLPTEPLLRTRRLARSHACDLAIPNGAGIGNILMYTRVVEDLAFYHGHPLRILTGPLRPSAGKLADEAPFPIWQCNPCIDEIINAENIDSDIIDVINQEMDNCCQFNHMIENLSILYGVKPRHLRPSIYLDASECRWALQELATLRRPILCLHPYGSSSSLRGCSWYEDEWRAMLSCVEGIVSPIEVGLNGVDMKDLPTWKRRTTLRQMFALVWASDIFVGFDSSAAHVATAFQKPAAVLWDPLRKVEIEERLQCGFGAAAFTRWSYPQNLNLMLLGDRGGTIRELLAAWIRDTCVRLGRWPAKIVV